MKRNRNISRIFLGTALVLLVPLVAMQFTEEVDWNLFDFIVMGVLLLGTGFTYELLVSKLVNPTHRIALGVVLLAALLLVWAELAVGVFGTPMAGS